MPRLRFLFLIICTGTIFWGNAQSLKLSGKVLNAKNEPLPGTSVKIVGAAGGTTTDVEGRFVLSLAAGKKYELEFSAIGFATKTISDAEVVSGQLNELNIILDVLAKSGENVVVTGTRSNARKETIASAISFQKNTNTVAQVVSAESIRRSPDKNTGEVLKRVPGTSIQEGKYLIVRGLADRYNQAMLNGVLLSSTEPDRKTFSFDILPSSIIDNIVINKAFVPELPGEWAGGLIQVNTNDVPAKDFLNLQIGTGFNTNTIGKDFYTYKGSNTDFLGFDNGFRSLPADFPNRSTFANLDNVQRAALGASLKNIWTADNNVSGGGLLNQSFLINGGFTKNLGNKSKLAAVFAVNYNKSNRRTTYENRIIRSQAGTTADIYFDYFNNKYNQEILEGALGNITLQLGDNNKISFKNLLNVNTSDYATLRTGLDFEGRTAGVPDNIRATELAYKENVFFNTQLTGDHNIKKYGVKFHWYGSFNILDQYIPDQRRVQYVQDDPTVASSPYIILIPVSKSSQKNGSRYFGYLSDYIYTAAGDLSKSFKIHNLSQTIKGGYFFQVKDRLFDSRPFAVYNPSGTSQFQNMPQDEVFASQNFTTKGSDDKLYFNELAGDRYRYIANSILNAGFLQLDNQIAQRLRIVWGLRVEDFDQVVGSLRKSDPRFVHNRVTDFLPGLNLTYKINPQTNFRVSASQTVVRPEFRELSTFEFYDFDLSATIAGNPSLVRTKVTNFDLRYEIYPRAAELFTIGVFYKYFKNPLEAYLNPGSGDASTYDLLNASEANAFGAEFEFRKKLDFNEALKNFTFQGNLSYIFNRVKSLDRPMQGQSPYVINVSLQYDLEKQGLSTTLLFNEIGRRISLVGGGDNQPPIWENPRPLLDFQIAKKLFNKRGEIKLNVADILNKESIFYLDLNDNKKYDVKADAFAIKRKFGTNISFTLGYNF